MNLDSKTNTISISHPNHRTHHLGTCFILELKRLNKINYVRKQAYNLKKFLDFISIWEIDLLECDLLIVLASFTDHLRCIEHSPVPPFTPSSHYYSSIKTLPLNNAASSLGKVIKLGYSQIGLPEKIDWSTIQYGSMKEIVSTAVKYIIYLHDKTLRYQALSLNQLPTKAKKSNSMLSGTLGYKTVELIDIEYILAISNLSPPKYNKKFKSDLMVLQLHQINSLISIIPPSDYQNKLLFTVLKVFGLRRGEAINLKVDVSKLNPKFIYLDNYNATEDLKQNLSGDLEYNNILKKWVCHVTPSNSVLYDRQTKTGSRSIPLVFSENEFVDTLIYGIKERFILMNNHKFKHEYLFVSKHCVDRGRPISGSTVADRFNKFANTLYNQTQQDLREYSPHSIRHFFATYLIRVKKHSISDVSKWLGHSSEDITRETYFHYIDAEATDKHIAKDMLNTFKKEIAKIEF